MRVLIVLLGVSLTTSGFAHRFVTPADQAVLDYAQALGVDVADICGDVEGGGAQKDCDACRLHAAMSMPEPAVALRFDELSLSLADWTPRPPVPHTLAAEATRPARAPPVV
ncbi:polyketide synthase [Rhodalgimonas zhirmunskyi]|uniref:Polyketide synthase n=1 Tax=Rhodalgimonas zhirmunskyi TaxID=2964767 RepID=A0AAJ1X5E3_9RHOB|nr:polyketide synthase [Rhodoalgimonas zhirmunskyi]MDQ2094069.1 polyketide synthase [Rhodoalgimonas zhirmunskyi]